ncbi:uncharacterized protein H6S33_008407 [Morchella sextelata]|uniref:uncharacterized protein n=1 Tax=Morchella sextelata TaxID=1174677 RepID=UPI001D0542D7|nr:uncharacterized protein H6S33_008407 [Morchella sextelata]KAH0602757.1 hypothetical protein H6S33_008407 [Morchella sextelata]
MPRRISITRSGHGFEPRGRGLSFGDLHVRYNHHGLDKTRQNKTGPYAPNVKLASKRVYEQLGGPELYMKMTCTYGNRRKDHIFFCMYILYLVVRALWVHQCWSHEPFGGILGPRPGRLAVKLVPSLAQTSRPASFPAPNTTGKVVQQFSAPL